LFILPVTIYTPLWKVVYSKNTQLGVLNHPSGGIGQQLLVQLMSARQIISSFE